MPDVPVRVLEAQSLAELRSFSSTAGRVSVDAAGRWLAYAGQRVVWLWSLAQPSPSGDPKPFFTVPSSRIRRIELSFDGRWLFTSIGDGFMGRAVLSRIGADGTRVDVDTANFEQLSMFTDYAVFSPDNRWLLTGAGDERVLWRLAPEGTNAPISLNARAGSSPPYVVFSSDSRWMLVSSGPRSNSSDIWLLEDIPTLAHRFNDGAVAAQFERNGGGVFVTTADDTVVYRSLAGDPREPLETVDFDQPMRARNVTRGESDGWIAVDVSVGNGEMLTLVQWNAGAAGSLRLNAPGSTRQSNASRLGDNGWEIHSSDVHSWASGQSQRAAFFVQNDRWLVRVWSPWPGGADPIEIRVIPLEPGLYVNETLRLARRNMTTREWADYMPGEPYRKTFGHLPDGRGQGRR